MNHKEIQTFRSASLLSFLGLVLLAGAVVATPWNSQLQDSRVQAARQKAEVVGYQVAQLYREASILSQKSGGSKGRHLASTEDLPANSLENLRSTGTMGLDPWGESYRYRILSSPQSSFVKVLVWSAGPNKRVETSHLDDESKPLVDQPIYLGDDVGVLLSVTQK